MGYGGPSAVQLGNCTVGNLPLGKLPVGKSLWETTYHRSLMKTGKSLKKNLWRELCKHIRLIIRNNANYLIHLSGKNRI